MQVRYRSVQGWSLELPEADMSFTFDLPRELYGIFREDGRLDRDRSRQMKLDHFDQINAYRVQGGEVQTLVLYLDTPWSEGVDSLLG